MVHTNQKFIPLLTSNAGLCLTLHNWEEVKIKTASYTLEHLLYKPGKEFLNTVDNLTQYLACPGEMVINALTLVANQEGIYILKSPYDGSKIKCSLFDLFELINHLKPQAVILPKNILQDFPQVWDNWNESITPFIHPADLEKEEVTNAHGVYFNVINELNWEQLDQWSHKPRYVMGNFEPELIHSLSARGIEFIETDEPAQAAMQGIVYSKKGHINLTNSETAFQCEPIDEECACPTCSQQFTKAYLHHLLAHTPLLCQRFLIQHNVFYARDSAINLG